MGKISSVRITSPEKVRGRRFTLFVKMRRRDERLGVQARGRELSLGNSQLDSSTGSLAGKIQAQEKEFIEKAPALHRQPGACPDSLKPLLDIIFCLGQ
jgi:hypothetical protein